MTGLNLFNISVRYKPEGIPVLSNISLSVDAQDIVVILGPSGSGKTTLLNLVAGFIKPSRGRLTLNGNPIDGPSAERAVVFQDDVLLPWKSVAGNIAFGLELAGVPRLERQAKTQKLLQLVHLSEYANHKVWELSGGQKQRIGIARAIAVEPQLLLLDEPFGALDTFTREQMQILLLELWQRTSKPALMITHDIEEAVFLASHLIIMAPYPGRISHEYRLDFNKRFLDGQSIRQIRQDPAFVEICLDVRDKFLNQSLGRIA